MKDLKYSFNIDLQIPYYRAYKKEDKGKSEYSFQEMEFGT